MIHELDPDDRLIDRLVDGDLPEPDRHALLLRLDAEPDGRGWRRCALAFLEQREWSAALGEFVREAEPVPVPAVPIRSRSARWLRPTARAAALLAAFGLGWSASRRPEPTTPLAAPPAPAIATADPPSPPVETPSADPPRPSQDDRPVPGPRERFRLASQRLAPPPAEPGPPIVPDYLRSRLERQGYRLEQAPGLAAVELNDGRRVVVPVEKVQVRYVGRPTF